VNAHGVDCGSETSACAAFPLSTVPRGKELLLAPERPRPGLRRLAFTVVSAAALVSPLAAPAAADTADGAADLRADIDALLADPALEGALSGVVVRSLTEGDVLYSAEADTPVVPASNVKLLTSAAALEVLGPDYQFETTVAADRDPVRGTVKGDLYLAGTGDPGLTPEAFDALAAEVAAEGVTEVTGDLVADDTWFDDDRYNAAWDPTDAPYYYAAQISALTVAANDDLDTGVVNVSAVPGAAEGDPAAVELDPMTDNLALDNQVTTGAADSTGSFAITRADGTNDFTATGSLPTGGSEVTTLRTVDDPTAHAVHLFANALADHGVKIHGDIERGAVPRDTEEVADRESMELDELLVPFMKLSNNMHAEILVKAMGAETTGEGSWAAGLAQVGPALDRIGADHGATDLVDGSGLSHGNVSAASTMIDVLEATRDEPWHDAWYASLPVAGAEDRLVGGTLANRMNGTAAEGNVHAKTGSLTGASALSGYVTTADGEELAFAVINNDYTGAAPRAVQDAIAVRLAEFSRTDVAAAPSVSTLRQQAPESESELECTWAGTC
jgi:D-alanyl-D-alanine carboxypeptidase/D-alanyl-D-alanine-endopeptidase (penicillin-binding protein 4)